MISKSKNILHLSSAAIWRGAEQQIIYLYEGLLERGHHQTLFCLEKGKLAEYCSQHSIPHQTFQKRTGINENLVVLLLAFIRKHPVDIIHIHDPHAHHAYLAAYLLGVRTPAILHRRVDFVTADTIFSAWKYQIKGIKKIVCVSERVKNIFATQAKIYDKCEVLYDCVNIEEFQKINGRTLLENDYPILKGKKIIANISALVDHKDIPTFIKAAHYIVKILQKKDLHFLIIGEGSMKAEIQKLIADYHLQQEVTLTGFRTDLHKILNGIDIYTFTSKMEGFGSTLLQVMAARVPIVATRVGGPAEILSHQKDALLAAVGDYIKLAQYIEDLIQDEELAKKLCQNAFQKVQNFSITAHIQKIEEIYESLDID